ncbi:hypothetical protein NP493_8g05058 [Ridgeia piscesae]|uniref:Uncharacterized protein n=1 Tax=Ridgeia piscesae TaxID=27915 RepID=A0AAD9PF85_RIDPI|nr:hypothetical protein NP493_8g05058 [Ridgeia piscesae]
MRFAESRPGRICAHHTASHLEAERVDDGVEPVDTDGREHVHRRRRQHDLGEAHEFTQAVAEDPATGQHAAEQPRHDGEGDAEVTDGEGDDEVVGGRLQAATAVDDEAHEQVAEDREQPQQDERSRLRRHPD